MEINWVVVGWIIDMILNGVVWLVIAALALLLIDITDKWTRKALKFMGKIDEEESQYTLKHHIVSYPWHTLSTRNNTEANNLIRAC